MKTKFYIASKLENHRAVSRLASALINAGHEHTYDWTTHGNVKYESAERLREVGNAELRGVMDADVVIIILPGGRGTHFEFGAAMGAGTKRVFLCAEDEKYFQSGEDTTAFYFCDGIVQCIGGAMEDWLAEILEIDTGFAQMLLNGACLLNGCKK